MESQESHGSSSSEAKKKKKKKKLFYTTSDIMNTINKSIASVDSKDDAISPRVELQRRMPDGSTRPANDKDLEAADMESKLKQVSKKMSRRLSGLFARLAEPALTISHNKHCSFATLYIGSRTSGRTDSQAKD
jgi:hypothetical protein